MAHHHERGCIVCGDIRKAADMLSKKYDVYLLDSENKTLVRVGLCVNCFQNENFDYPTLKEKLYQSEKLFRIQNGMTDWEAEKSVDNFKTARFTRHVSRADFMQSHGYDRALEYIEAHCER